MIAQAAMFAIWFVQPVPDTIAYRVLRTQIFMVA